ncbi:MULTISPECIES: hypothetical protein [unclassified Crossiella]|uniref:hypothetical protein n=1 Tax=unclassified Crossiella TaxID=2620835 RepID=UPI001FFE760E|nr:MULTISPECIES: hypothetical protein [unclassified Crossiella]MCK2239821.1 hypothetical protein [Crossiella sp. S99.2]MCK2252516.1 hypothetical protein [Crossiella sp. S99.1]
MKRLMMAVVALAALGGLGTGLASALSAQVSMSVDGGSTSDGCEGGCGATVLAECGAC